MGHTLVGCLDAIAASLGSSVLAGTHIEFPCCFVLPLAIIGVVLIVRGTKRRDTQTWWPDEEPPIRQCPRCRHPVGDRPRARFCPTCGARLDD